RADGPASLEALPAGAADDDAIGAHLDRLHRPGERDLPAQRRAHGLRDALHAAAHREADAVLARLLALDLRERAAEEQQQRRHVARVAAEARVHPVADLG